MVESIDMLLSNKELETIRRKASVLGIDCKDMIMKSFNGHASKVIDAIFASSYEYTNREQFCNKKYFERRSTIEKSSERWDIIETIEVSWQMRKEAERVIRTLDSLRVGSTTFTMAVNVDMHSKMERVRAGYKYMVGAYSNVKIERCSPISIEKVLETWERIKEEREDSNYAGKILEVGGEPAIVVFDRYRN